ncbi:GTP-binding protein, partial [Angustibacter peucedani]
MHVLATAGHVDHGKSSLVRALTGQEPDRHAEERRRGLTLDLGFVWTVLGTGPDAEQLAFVDVPGHERFVPTMLAGVGPVPAVVLVVAADEGWKPQTQEHVDALDALGVRHGLVVVSRSDLADPGAVAAQSVQRLSSTSLAGAEVVAASARTGEGLDDVRAALLRLVRSLPAPDLDAPVRLWVDRSFTVRGSGTVVTGTLDAGTLRRGDRLVVSGGDGPPAEVAVRGLQSLEHPYEAVPAVARVAVNLRGVERADVGRGHALVTPGRFVVTASVDVRLRAPAGRDLPDRAPSTTLLHLGSAQVEAHVRPLSSDLWRLRLARPLPLHVGDAGLLRDPGRHAVLAGLTVLDVDPPALRRRGSAAARAADLLDLGGRPDPRDELRRRGVTSRAFLRAGGATDADLAALPAGDWLVDPVAAEELAARLASLVGQHDDDHPLDRGLPLDVARAALDLPHSDVVGLVVRPPLAVRRGRVVRAEDDVDRLPEPVETAVASVLLDLAQHELEVVAPSAEQLAAAGLGRPEVAA